MDAENIQVLKIKEVYEETVKNGITLETDLKNIDYYSAVCKYLATFKNTIKMFGHDLCSFKTEKNGEKFVIMLFYIPAKNNYDNDGKHIMSRVMGIVKVLEEAFTTLSIRMDEVEEDHYSYLIAVKKVK